jgi:hypothetical protein
MISELGQMVTFALPVRDDASLEADEMDSAISNVYVHQVLGHGPIWDAITLFRDSGATATPGWVATGTPSATKTTIQKLSSFTDTSLTEAPDTSANYDWIRNQANIRSVTRTGNYSKYSVFMAKTASYGPASTDGWNNGLARWLASKFYNPFIYTYAPFTMLADNMMGFMFEDRSIAIGARAPTSDPVSAATIPIMEIPVYAAQKNVTNQFRLNILQLLHKALTRNWKKDGPRKAWVLNPVTGRPIQLKPKSEMEAMYKNAMNAVISGSKDLGLAYIHAILNSREMRDDHNLDGADPEGRPDGVPDDYDPNPEGGGSFGGSRGG